MATKLFDLTAAVLFGSAALTAPVGARPMSAIVILPIAGFISIAWERASRTRKPGPRLYALTACGAMLANVTI